MIQLIMNHFIIWLIKSTLFKEAQQNPAPNDMKFTFGIPSKFTSHAEAREYDPHLE